MADNILLNNRGCMGQNRWEDSGFSCINHTECSMLMIKDHDGDVLAYAEENICCAVWQCFIIPVSLRWLLTFLEQQSKPIELVGTCYLKLEIWFSRPQFWCYCLGAQSWISWGSLSHCLSNCVNHASLLTFHWHRLLLTPQKFKWTIHTSGWPVFIIFSTGVH